MPGAAALLLAAMVLASLVGLFAAPALIERSLFRPYWLLPRREYPTLVTSAFVARRPGAPAVQRLHLLGLRLRARARDRLDALLALYAFGLLASDAGTWFKHRRDPEYRTLGASGAILAVLFASIVYFPTGSIFILPIPVPIPAPLFALGYLAYTYYAARLARGRINHDAHLSGAIAGLAFVVLTDPAAIEHAWRSVFG